MTTIAEFQKPDTLIITTNGASSTVRRAAIVATPTTNGVGVGGRLKPTTSVITVKPIVKSSAPSNMTGIFATSLLSPKPPLQQQPQQLQLQPQLQSQSQQLTEKKIILGSRIISSISDYESMNVFRVASAADEEEVGSIGSDGVPRKRRRLTHLSPEEKIQRRKLKNRVAAQTARDRKKAQMSDMEVAIDKLQTENKKLLHHNLVLQKKTSELINENAELRQRLGQLTNGGECSQLSTTAVTATTAVTTTARRKTATSSTTSTSSPTSSSSSLSSLSSQSSTMRDITNNNRIASGNLCKSEALSSPVKTESKCSRSAVPFVSLPQKHILILFHLMMRWTFLAAMMNLANCGSFWMKSAIQSLKTQPLQHQLQILRILQLMSFSQKRVPIQWWGPQQHSWTPSMN